MEHSADFLKLNIQQTITLDDFDGDEYYDRYPAIIYDRERKFILDCSGTLYLRRLMYVNGKFEIDNNVIKLPSIANSITYHPSKDIYLIGCSEGYILSYDPKNHLLNTILKRNDMFTISQITLINDDQFAFIPRRNYDEYDENSDSLIYDVLCLGNLDSNNVVIWNGNGITKLFGNPSQNQIYIGDNRGKLFVYAGDLSNGLKLMYQMQLHKVGSTITSITNCLLNGVQYIVTNGSDRKIKIINISNGKTIKSFNTITSFNKMNYLEPKNILVCSNADALLFYNLINGKQIMSNIDNERQFIYKQSNDNMKKENIVHGFTFAINNDIIGIANDYSNIIQIISIEYLTKIQEINSDIIKSYRDYFWEYLRNHENLFVVSHKNLYDQMLMPISNALTQKSGKHENNNFNLEIFWRELEKKIGDQLDLNLMDNFYSAMLYANSSIKKK